MKKNEIEELKKAALKEFKRAKNVEELNDIFKKYLGKSSQVSLILGKLKTASLASKKKTGKAINDFKKEVREEFEKRKKELKKTKGNIGDWFDITAPGEKQALGHLHPLTIAQRKMMLIFQTMGFSVVEGPQIETDWYNFDALNIPKEHPARDMWDTFWLKPEKADLLLRTHTSPVQIRYMEKHQPPLRIIAPGRLFRHEATDASHEFQLYQLEGLMIGKEVSAANFKAVLEEFFKRFFNKEIKIRLRPSYFPFVEPGFEVDINCVVCNQRGCSVCKKSGWVELMGAGMVHPRVLENSGVDSKKWQGFAFGMGIDRLAMMKWKIDEIRWFHSSDLRFLKQF